MEKIHKVLEEIKEKSETYAVEAQNYVSFDNGMLYEEMENEKNEDKKKLLNSIKGFTCIVKIDGEKVSNKEVKQKVGDFDDFVKGYGDLPLAVEIEGISSGNELKSLQGRITAAFMKNTSGISKDKSDRSKASAKKRYEISYKKALKSDYSLNIKADKIKDLTKYMKGEEIEFEGMTIEDALKEFDKMKTVLGKAGIDSSAVVYQYAEFAYRYAKIASEDKNANNADKIAKMAENYASAKAYLRAAVENYLERQYLSAVGTERSKYINSVGISDRNAIRGLLLHIALNEDALSADKVKNLLEEEEQKLLLGGDKTLSALRTESNKLINKILADPFEGKEDISKAKQALTVVSESIASSGIDKAMEAFKDGTFASTQTIKQILSAA